jgi:hypothetical protein
MGVDAADEDPRGRDARARREPRAKRRRLLRRQEAEVALDEEQVGARREVERAGVERVEHALGDAHPRAVAHHRHAERRLEGQRARPGAELAHVPSPTPPSSPTGVLDNGV